MQTKIEGIWKEFKALKISENLVLPKRVAKIKIIEMALKEITADNIRPL